MGDSGVSAGRKFGLSLINLGSEMAEKWPDFNHTQEVLTSSIPEDDPMRYFTALIVGMALDVRAYSPVDEETCYYGPAVTQTLNIFICFFILVVCVYLLNELLGRIVWKVLILRAFMVCFFVSILWNYCLEYKKAVAKKFLLQNKGIPPGCMEHGTTLYSILTTFANVLASINHEEIDSDCLQFAMAVVVEPIWEITPIGAFLVTITDLFVTPIQATALCVNKTFKIMFTGIPLFFIPIFTVITLYTISILLVFTFKYQVRIPLFLEMTPMLRGGPDIGQQPTGRRMVKAGGRRRLKWSRVK